MSTSNQNPRAGVIKSFWTIKTCTIEQLILQMHNDFFNIRLKRYPVCVNSFAYMHYFRNWQLSTCMFPTWRCKYTTTNLKALVNFKVRESKKYTSHVKLLFAWKLAKPVPGGKYILTSELAQFTLANQWIPHPSYPSPKKTIYKH